jgi:hypothetical protein
MGERKPSKWMGFVLQSGEKDRRFDVDALNTAGWSHIPIPIEDCFSQLPLERVRLPSLLVSNLRFGPFHFW